jgi:hypothetical protein
MFEILVIIILIFIGYQLFQVSWTQRNMNQYLIHKDVDNESDEFLKNLYPHLFFLSSEMRELIRNLHKRKSSQDRKLSRLDLITPSDAVANCYFIYTEIKNQLEKGGTQEDIKILKNLENFREKTNKLAEQLRKERISTENEVQLVLLLLWEHISEYGLYLDEVEGYDLMFDNFLSILPKKQIVV